MNCPHRNIAGSTIDVSKYKNNCMACEFEAMKNLLKAIYFLNKDEKINKLLLDFYGFGELNATQKET